MNEPTLFTPEPCRSTRKQRTRWQTMDQAWLLKRNDALASVFTLICGQPRTCDEVEEWMGRSHQTVSSAINSLMTAGFIVASGERRKTRSGRAAIVWSRSITQSAAAQKEN